MNVRNPCSSRRTIEKQYGKGADFGADAGGTRFLIINMPAMRRVAGAKKIAEKETKKVKVEVLGVGCSKCNKLYELIKDIIAKNGIDADVSKVEDLKKFSDYGVFMTPGLVIDGEVKAAGKVPKEKEILRWLTAS
jgi:small redox-active disulfide protein 2